MKQYLKMMGASLKMTYREKVALFWMFLFPIILMLLLGAIFGRSGEANLNIGLVVDDSGPVAEAVTGAFGKVKAFKTSRGKLAEQLDRLRDGRLNAVVVIPSDFSKDVMAGHTGRVTVYVDKSQQSTAEVTQGAISQLVEGINAQYLKMMKAPAQKRLVEIAAPKKDINSNELRYVDYLVPGILALTMMTSGLLGLSLQFVMYREKGILRRVKVSPIPLSRFMGGELTADLLMALIQAGVLLLVGWLVFRINVNGNPLYIIFLVLLGAASFQALGFLIASLTKTLKTAQMVANVISFPMMFLSGVFFPMAILPTFLVVIAKCLPLYYLGHALRQVMILGQGLGAVWVDIVVLLGMGLVCFLVSIKLFRWE